MEWKPWLQSIFWQQPGFIKTSKTSRCQHENAHQQIERWNRTYEVKVVEPASVTFRQHGWNVRLLKQNHDKLLSNPKQFIQRRFGQVQTKASDYDRWANWWKTLTTS